MSSNSKIDPVKGLEVYLRNKKNISQTARDLGVHRRSVDRFLSRLTDPKIITPKYAPLDESTLYRDEEDDDRPLMRGSIGIEEYAELPIPPQGEVYSYIFSSAQNNTPVHAQLMDNIEAFAKHYDAKIHISRFTYDKNSYRTHQVKPGTKKSTDDDDLFYDARTDPYVSGSRLVVAPGLHWCGELNILPTAVTPLSGLETYTGRASGIIPHAKIAMESLPAMTRMGEGTKFNYTTGTVTQHNYIDKKAGQKARFHHCYAFLFVEVDSDGNWFCRQVNATSDGSFQDLDVCVRDGKVTTGHHIEAANWGDIHVSQQEPVVYDLSWGNSDSIIDTLRPKYQFFNDLFDMQSRNHHDEKNCHLNFKKFVTEEENVCNEIHTTALWLQETKRDFCTGIVVDSNHDQQLERWLRDANYKTDPVNAMYYLELQKRKYKAIQDNDENFHLLEWSLQDAGCPKNVKFLREDDSFVLCHEAGGGIECGLHGHLGVNGSRGSPKGFIKLGRKANTGHTHSAGIRDGVYTAGTCSMLRLSYNRGPSSWSWSHILTYESGKRVIVTIFNGKWKAQRVQLSDH